MDWSYGAQQDRRVKPYFWQQVGSSEQFLRPELQPNKSVR